MFTLVRDPVKTVISAYFHFKHLINLSFEELCEKSNNMQTKFLLGYDILSDYKVTAEDVLHLKSLVEEHKLTAAIIGTPSIQRIHDLLGINLKNEEKYMLNKKVDVHYKLSDFTQKTRKKIEQLNSFDQSFYEFIKQMK